MNENMKKVAINYGLLTASVGIIFTLGCYIIDESLFVNPVGSILVLIISVVIPFFAIRSYKKLNNGFATFREAFSAYMLPVIFSLFVSLIFNLLMYNVIDSELSSRQGEMAFEAMMEMPEEQLQTTIQFMGIDSVDDLEDKIVSDAKKNVTIVGQLRSSAVGFILFAFIALIAAAVSKKNLPEFE
tara:strand:- start:43 stop:597 length:555 start_codon:yes stop_codon:yes gene_type:complete